MKPHYVAALAGAALFAAGALATAKSDKADKAEKSDKAEKMARSVGAAPSGSTSVRSVQAEMAESFRQHRPKPKELEEKMAELKATASARRAAHMAEVRVRFSPTMLHNKALVAELRSHARRVAFLNRAKFIASTELDEPKRSAALTRIDKLMTREQQRHERHVEKLKLTPPEPGPSGAPSAAAAPAPSGSAK